MVRWTGQHHLLLLLGSVKVRPRWSCRVVASVDEKAVECCCDVVDGGAASLLLGGRRRCSRSLVTRRGGSNLGSRWRRWRTGGEELGTGWRVWLKWWQIGLDLLLSLVALWRWRSHGELVVLRVWGGYYMVQLLCWSGPRLRRVNWSRVVDFVFGGFCLVWISERG